ncbi:hypothetical protein CMUS01_05742 [Colletotrichum musicola]|uniref:2EXR domain-containing protein n=1 Tax=Colletotrichum musicola TaxID=2175873 RepID=A0A8H6NJW0_9PEZI|nr:hypothetical protein CMUS01_05742 [Colletotrichum musicola]
MAASPVEQDFLSELDRIDLSEPFSPAFHKFASLPAELRFRIWRLATPRQTLVDRSMDKTMSYTLRRHGSVPAVLHACRESRAELVYHADDRRGARDEQYEMVHVSEEDEESGRGVYVNCQRDTLYLYRAPNRGIMPNAASYASVENLAMEWGLRPCWVQGQCHEGVKFIRQFPSLRTLTIVVTFKVVVMNSDCSASEKNRRERAQKRRAMREIRSEILQAVEAAAAAESGGPGWTPPEIRVVPKTKFWTR